MGSTVTKLSNTYNTKNIFGEERSTPVYLQFVPGVVVSSITSKDTSTYGGNVRNINSIIAIPHIGSDIKNKSDVTEKNRYFPLFRGWVDTPVEGDQVLLCTMGGVQYYIGPTNTVNSPNWNIDHLNIDDLKTKDSSINSRSRLERESTGLSKNFMNTNTARLQKKYNNVLDNPDENKEIYNQIHGDMLFEGRHGNSLRIGSRHFNPYIIISNSRNYTNSVEGIVDGSIIAILDKGSLRQHFNSDKMLDEDESIIENPYILSSDKPELESNRLMADLISNVNDEEDPEVKIYDFGDIQSGEENQNQIFISSDRITLDSKNENIFLSSYKDIHIGAGGNLTISTNREFIIESSNIYIGKDAKISEEQQPLVLGNKLMEVIEELIDNIGSLYVGGIPSTGVSMDVLTTSSPGWLKLTDLKKKIKTILSEYHFIENNGQKA